ncbi:acyltransferase family protein [Ruminococcus sp.]|uniref:acyltransferase family protein n=1 Tax=Ruminococcus sp. TaxID=41978 RepID=UPI00388F292C
MSNNSISITRSNQVKGIAIILMMVKHLFGSDSYLTLESSHWFAFFPGFVKIIYHSASLALPIFLFFSGYGLYKSYISKPNPKPTYILQRIIKTLIPYWIVMAFTIVYLIIKGKFEVKYLFINLFSLLHNDDILYVSFSWFIKLYLGLILLLPLFRMLQFKIKLSGKKRFILDCVIYLVIPAVIGLALKRFYHEKTYIDMLTFILSSIRLVFWYFSSFGVGILFAKYNIYEKIRYYADMLPRALVLITTPMFCLSVLLVKYFISYKTVTEVFYTVVFTISCLLFLDYLNLNVKWDVLAFLGKHSVFYWLLSGFFFLNTSELQFIIYYPRYHLLIVVWLLLLLTPMVFLCNWLSGILTKPICNAIDKIGKPAKAQKQ